MTITKHGFTFIRDQRRAASWTVFFGDKLFARVSTAAVARALAA